MTDAGMTPEDTRDRFAAARDAVTDLVAGVDDAEAFGAAFAALGQVARQLDFEQLLNTPHMPKDAGEYAPRLAKMLARIPDGWGRWISVGAGWYPIVCELDEQLEKLFPDYQLEQVKEKYAGLRYYATFQTADVHDPADPPPPFVGRDASDAEREAWNEATEAWAARNDAWLTTEEGQRMQAELDRRQALADELIAAAEARAETTCELCGADGQLCCSAAPHPWYKTLCPAHMAEADYMPAGEWKAWWADEKPRFEARQRQRFIDENAGRRVLVATADPDARVSLPQAQVVADPIEVAELADEWDVVFVADDEVGRAYCQALIACYPEHQALLQEKKRQTEAAGKRWFGGRCPEKFPRLFLLGDTRGLRGALASVGGNFWTAQPQHRPSVGS